MSRQVIAPKKRIIIAIGKSESEIESLEKSLGGRDDLLIIASPTYDENTLEGLRGQVNGVTRFDILAHGGVINKEHHFQSGPQQSTPTKNLFTKLREIVGEETPLTNVNLWSCFGGAAAKDVKELGASSTLICHADEKFETLVPTTLSKIIAAETQTGRESFIDSCLHSPETVTFSYCTKIGGEVLKHTARRSSRAITVDDELSRHLTKEFKKFSLFLTDAGLPTDDLSAANLSAEAIQKYLEEDILLSALRDNPKRLQKYSLAEDSSGNKKFNLNQITIAQIQVSPMVWAAKNGHSESVKTLIDCGANVNFKNTDTGTTALMYASAYGHKDVVKKLISSGADINITSDAGATALMSASQNGHTGVVEELILGKADVNIENDKKLTALTLASINGHTDVVKKLILGGANVAFADGNLHTALTLALINGHTESAKVLIENGANVNFEDNAGNTALILASQYGYADIVKKLISSGADVNFKNNAGFTPLMFAAHDGHGDVVNELIEGGANVSIADGAGSTALSYAWKRGEEDPIYGILKTSLDRPKVDTKQNRFSSQSSLIVGTPSTSITAMAATAFFAVAAAALFMWKHKGRHADQEHRPRTKVENPLAEQAKKGAKKDKPKGGKAL
jgi:ankyrin repeat protein